MNGERDSSASMRLRSGIEFDSGKSADAQDIAAAAHSATSPVNFRSLSISLAASAAQNASREAADSL